MNKFSLVILLLSVTLTLTSCGDKASDKTNDAAFVVTGVLPDSVAVDSVSLSVIREDYHQYQLLSSVAVENNRFEITGEIDSPRIAVLNFSPKQTTLFFILSPGHTDFNITRDKLVCHSAGANRDYFLFLKRRMAIETAIKANRAAYERLCADSTLTAAREREMQARDSLLRDSLDAFTAHSILRRDLPAAIIAHRYYTTLDSVHQQMILNY